MGSDVSDVSNIANGRVYITDPMVTPHRRRGTSD